VGSAFGAAGSLVIVLVWIYYSAQIFFFGAEFTQVYTNKYGSHVEPAANAEFVSEEDRAQEGIPSENQSDKKKREARTGRKQRKLKASPWFS
jgi:membrane protein